MSALLASGLAAAGLLRFLPATRAGRLLTLIYHRVLPERDPMFPSEVTATQFDQQMALLKRFCSPLPLRDAVEALQERRLPPRAVAVTFDDGYRDNFTQALPILRRHDVPATFFVATSFLDGGIMWNDAVIQAVRSAPSQKLQFPEFGVNAPQVSPVERGRLALKIIGRIKHLPQQERAGEVQRIVAQCGVSPPTDLMMSAAEVRGLHEAGMEVGAHTHTHPILRTLDDGSARAELDGNRDRLRQIIGADVTAFAYPNGRPGDDYGPRDRQIVEELGFRYAVATRWGVADRTTDRLQLPRFTPWDQDPARWLARLMLSYRNCVQ